MTEYLRDYLEALLKVNAGDPLPNLTASFVRDLAAFLLSLDPELRTNRGKPQP